MRRPDYSDGTRLHDREDEDSNVTGRLRQVIPAVERSLPTQYANSVGGEILGFDLSGGAVSLECGQACLDFQGVRIGFQGGELIIE